MFARGMSKKAKAIRNPNLPLSQTYEHFLKFHLAYNEIEKNEESSYMKQALVYCSTDLLIMKRSLEC